MPTPSAKGEGHALEEAFPADQFYALYEKQAGWFMINVCQGQTIWVSGTSLQAGGCFFHEYKVMSPAI